MPDDEDEKLPPYPESDERSFGYHVARTALDAGASFVPGAGYPVGKLVEWVVGEPLARRRDEWFKSLGEGLAELQTRLGDFDPSALSQNEDFISAVYEATDAAMRASHEEKRTALRNGVLNIAAGFEIDDALRGAFFDYVARFSVLHIDALRILADPRSAPRYLAHAEGESIGNLVTAVQTGISGTASEEAIERVLMDLKREDLIEAGELRMNMSGNGLLQKRTTPAGDAFLRFIAESVA